MLHESVSQAPPEISLHPLQASIVAVLDDDEDVAVSISHNLQRAGFRAFAYTSEHGLLAGARAEPFDALIADWMLGRDTAQAVIATLRSIERYRHIPMVVLSGNLCLNGEPTCPELRKAIVEHGLIFRCKPRRTADLVADIRASALRDLRA